MTAAVLAGLVPSGGCASHNTTPDSPRINEPTVVVVAPVLNMSNSTDFDALKLSDIVAAELTTFQGVAVIPVNRVLAALVRQGRDAVLTPEDALAIADEFGADATVVTAVTAYDGYTPAVGVVMQWYWRRRVIATEFDPVAASRLASESTPGPEAVAHGPAVQVQRYYNGTDGALQGEIREYGAKRDGALSPYGWRRYVVSQELFVRYCIWDSIRTMLSQGACRRSVGGNPG
ncbi:MAG: hypothetical protein LC135_03765 [Phycisphaerae bacterium]|nr:hypothetical protein [Phycisphaerae bacterium]MCZ2398970.1 hypothetical protein [Phycisphaerae bacterium]